MLSGYSAALFHPQENLFCGLAYSAPSLGFCGCSEEAMQCLETWLQVPWSFFIAGTSIITWTLMSVWKFGFLTVASFACDTLCQTQIMTIFVLLYNTKGFLTHLPESHLSLKIISTLGIIFFFWVARFIIFVQETSLNTLPFVYFFHILFLFVLNSISCEMNRQSRFDARDRGLGAGALGWPWGMGWEGNGRGVQDGEHMYARGWFISMYGKNHYNTVK